MNEKILGQPTRGKTARNRLRRADNFLLMYDASLFSSGTMIKETSYFVDLGYGAEPFTTLQSARTLRKVNSELPVLGVEIDPERVERAAPFEDRITKFRLGGFNLPLHEGEKVRAIRAFNVLRQYQEGEFEEPVRILGDYLMEGGLLLEGTSNPSGSIWVANLFRREAAVLKHEGLLFSTNFNSGFEPEMFQPVLPKNYIHHMLPGEAIYEFFQVWKRSARQLISLKEFSLRQWFKGSAEMLADAGYQIDLRRKFLNRGFLLWKYPGGLSPSEEKKFTV